MSQERMDAFEGGAAKRLARRLGLTKLTPEEAQTAFDNVSESVPSLAGDYIDDLVRFATGAKSDSPCTETDSENWQSVGPKEVEDDVLVLNRYTGKSSSTASQLLSALRSEALGVEGISKTSLDKQTERALVERADSDAEALIATLGIRQAPIDPFEIAASEKLHLIVKAGNFGDLFDGQLEFHAGPDKFLLFVNSKYDRIDNGTHHSRTRFSIAHELGHYFIEDHHKYLRTGGKIHRSRGEFFSELQREREADAFAAALLMPRFLFEKDLNQRKPTAKRITQLADKYCTSLLSTALRSVQLSHFPFAIAAIREGSLAWARCSESLVQAGCYPAEKGTLRSAKALAMWEQFKRGECGEAASEGLVRDWFRTYDQADLEKISVDEVYVAIPSMSTVLVMLTVDESELDDGDDDVREDDDS